MNPLTILFLAQAGVLVFFAWLSAQTYIEHRIPTDAVFAALFLGAASFLAYLAISLV